MVKRVFALIVLAASIGIAACSPAATTAPTLGGSTPTDVPVTSP
jgi:ABC-type glycerol-3-phosphate transport system substrate-binding protein